MKLTLGEALAVTVSSLFFIGVLCRAFGWADHRPVAPPPGGEFLEDTKITLTSAPLNGISYARADGGISVSCIEDSTERKLGVCRIPYQALESFGGGK